MTKNTGATPLVRAHLAGCADRLSFDAQALADVQVRHGVDDLAAMAELRYLVGRAATHGYCVPIDGGCWVVGHLGYEAVVNVVTETVVAYRALAYRLPSQVLPTVPGDDVGVHTASR